MTASLNARNVVAALVVAGLLLLPLYTSISGNIFVLTLFTRIVIFALAAASLNLIMGYGGMMSFGHAAYLGIGGYAVGILAHEGIGSGFIQWPVALAASALFALVIGALSLRTRGVYFIMITLAFAQMAYYVASGLARYGGDDGLTIYKRSDFGGLINLSNRVQFYYLCLGCLFGGIYLIWRIVNSRFGMVVQGLRSNEAAHAGDRVSRQPLPAGLLRHRRHHVRSGRRAARQQHRLRQSGRDVLDPFRRSHGHGHPRRHGLAVRPGDRSDRLSAAGRVLVAGDGILGAHHGPAAAADRAVRARRHRRACSGGCAVADPLLRVENLVRRFGGIVATDDLSLDVISGELHAIIGPNGAGKTTLISQLTGQLLPNSGTIRFAGRDITGLPAWRRSALGLARSFQITSLLPDFTASDNVALAAQAHDGHSFRFWGDARKESHLREAARSALDRVGLAHRADVVVSELSHGEQRELELAVALATRPQLLLLDEPMAGLGSTESARMVKLLQELRREVTIVLVEHDMEAVFALADRITVLVYGRVIASDVPAAIRQNEEVRRAYLGEQHAVTRHG